MKILHVVTLHSADNAFGGPVRVALNLATELKAQGDSVSLLAGSRGLPETDNIEGVPCQLFPVRSIHSKLGFSGMFSTKLWIWAWRNIKSFDVIHIHLARDLITLPIGLLAMIRGVPFIIQGHGMIDPTSKRLGQILDLLATRKLLKQAEGILYLTSKEEDGIRKVSRNLQAKMHFFPNGVPQNRLNALSDGKYVSFISRMHFQKHPELFVEMASILIAKNFDYAFRMAGADEGEVAFTLEAIEHKRLLSQIEYLGALDHTAVLELLRETKVLVLPSINETFPMIVLEALSIGVPVVITESCGLAPYISRNGGGIVTDGNPEQLATAVRTIASDFEAYSSQALELSVSEFSMAKILKQLNDVYRIATNSQKQFGPK